MPQGLEDIKSTLASITRGDGVIDLLMEFERTLDATEIFAYKNWYCGELIKGPDIGRYWFTTTWMFPHKLMPDPDGALRLEKIGCKVYYDKDTLMQPRRVLTPKDWKDQRTKEAKMEELRHLLGIGGGQVDGESQMGGRWRAGQTSTLPRLGEPHSAY